MKHTNKTRLVTTRIEPELRQAFYEQCKEFDLNPSELIREFIMASVQNRIKILPPTGVKNLYNL